MEGKNCFRQRWSQEPLYSGGNVSSLIVKEVKPGTEAELVDANTVITHDASTAVYVPKTTTAANDDDNVQNNDNSSKKKKKSIFTKFEALVMACGDEVNLVDAVTGERLASYQTLLDDQVLNVASVYVPEKPRSATASSPSSAHDAPPGSYIAISTRSLQVIVFEVKQEVEIVTELVSVKKKRNENTKVKGDAAEQKHKDDEEANDNAGADEEEDEEDEKAEVTRANFTERFYLKQVQAWTASQHAVAMLLFSPCGSYLLTGSTVGNVKGWNVFHHHLTHNMNMAGGGFITAMVLSNPISNSAVVTTAGGAANVLSKTHTKKPKKSTASAAASAADSSTPATEAGEEKGASAWSSGNAAAAANSSGSNTTAGTVPQFLAVGTAEGHVAVFNFATTKTVFATTQPHVSPVDALVFVEGVMSTKGETKRGSALLQQEWRLISAGRDRKCVSNAFSVDISDIRATPAANAQESIGELTYAVSSLGSLEEVRAVAFPEYSNCAVFEGRHKLHLGTIDGVVSTYAVDNNGRLSHLHRSPKPRGAGNIENLDDELTVKCVVVAAPRKALRVVEEEMEAPAVSVAGGEGQGGGEPSGDITIAEEEDTGLSCIYAADATFVINHYKCRPGVKTIIPTYTLIGHLDQILDIKLLDKPAVAAEAARAQKRREAFDGDDDEYESYSSSSSSSESDNENDNAEEKQSSNKRISKKIRKLRVKGPIHSCRRLVITNTKVPRIFEGVGCVSDKYLEGHTDIVMCAAISSDGKFLATGAKDKTVRVWDAQTLRCLAIGKEASHGVRGHSNEITGLVFSAKPTESYHMLYSTGADEMMCAWDPLDAIQNAKGDRIITEISTSAAAGGGKPTEVAIMEPRHVIAAIHDGPVHGLAIAPNDQFLATCSKDKVVSVWNIVGKKIYKEAGMKGHKRAVTAVAFSPTDRVLASCANDATIRLWSLASFSCVKTLQHESQKPILQLSFFNKGLQIVSTDAEGTMSVWALSTSEVITNLELHKEKVWALNVIESKDLKETYFVSGAADGTLVVTEDYTAEEALRLRQEHDETIMKEQQLSNAMRLGEYENAFRLALRLNHPRHLRQVLSKWLAVDEEEVESVVSTKVFPSLSVEENNRLLEFMREWLTNARYCHIASILLHCLFSAFHFTELERMRGLRAVLEAFVSYSNRHSQRMSQSLQRMYFIDYICRGHKAQQGGGLTLFAPFCPLVTENSAAKGTSAEQKRASNVFAASVAVANEARRQQEALVTQQKVLDAQHQSLADESAAALALANQVVRNVAPDSTAAAVTGVNAKPSAADTNVASAKKKSRVEGGSAAGTSNSHQNATQNTDEAGDYTGSQATRGKVRPVPAPKEEAGYGRGGNFRGGFRGSHRGGGGGARDGRQSVSGYRQQGGAERSGSSHSSGRGGGRGGGSSSRGGSRGGSFRGRGGQ